ncbi:MAG: undecaprenyldiphospho-muramoylpentapeptide beta-N-acetylglucosaminyltransferase [Alphaproteobacteria bacterium]|nr:MAG: undecaprenyldiphospho-muramoylpentapeptide beta-N-acetylglucosaminyltransferase [Alphaproteobacteria bacterium]
MTKGSIVIAAGGTGGHLFPAQSLSQEMVKRGYDVTIITDERGMAWEKAFEGAIMVVSSSATPYRRGLLGKIGAALTIGRAVIRNFFRLGRIKPLYVIGFGGYPSIPPMVAAILRGVPRMIHEQNGVMGRANRALASRMTAVAVTVPSPKGLPEKARAYEFMVGNPVRAEVVKQSRKPYPALVADGPIELLIFGGSQGATVFSDVVPAAIACLDRALLDRLKIHQQARPEDVERVSKAYREMGIEAEVHAFYDNLPELMAKAHLVISRSGASTVCELLAIGRPAIMVPLQQALDDDQGANAAYVVEAGGGWILRQEALTAEKLADHMGGLLANPSALTSAARIAKSLGRPYAARDLANLVEALIEDDRARLKRISEGAEAEAETPGEKL